MKALISPRAAAAVALSAVLLGACAASPTHESTGQYLDDTTITTKVKSELLASEGVWSADLSVKTVQGVVQLSGLAKSEQDRSRAGQIAQSVAGVKQVDNQIRVQ
jgi:hyperosmotically inducible protein